jgi:hypothetical protein
MAKHTAENVRQRDLEKEYLVKAAMLIKILQQTTWPEISHIRHAQPSSASIGWKVVFALSRFLETTVVRFIGFIWWEVLWRRPEYREKQARICIIGNCPFSTKSLIGLARVSKGDLKYKVILSNRLPKRFCDMIFIAQDKADEVDSILKAIGSAPMLTVSDIPGFANKGGNIEFFIFADRVKLLINERVSKQKGFTYGPEMHNPKVTRFIHTQSNVSNTAPTDTGSTKRLALRSKILLWRNGPQTLH